jgi:arginyl-tRNA synthetase
MALADVFSSQWKQHNVDMDVSEFDGVVFPTPKPEKFGDYQCNVCMPLGKHLKMKPREVATQLLARLQVDDLVAEASVAGPGFLNFRCELLN